MLFFLVLVGVDLMEFFSKNRRISYEQRYEIKPADEV